MKCKFYSRCEYADSRSFMCMENGGGSYCGKFRAMSKESLPSRVVPLSFERKERLDG